MTLHARKNMIQKTGGLAYPADPLAAMRGLRELDDGESGQPTVPQPQPPIAPVQPSQTPRAAEAPGGTLEEEVPGGPAGRGQRRTGPAAPRVGEDWMAPEGRMRAAILETLREPYPAGWQKGPHRAATVKLPAELWERLAWAAKLTGEAKQDIIAEALRDHLHRLAKGR